MTELGEEMEVEHLGGAGAAGAAGLRSSPFEEGGGVAPAGATARGQWDSDVLGRVRLAHGALSGDPPDPQLAYNSLREAVASIEAIGGQVQFEENARLYLDLMYVRDLLNNDLIALAPHAGVKAPMERIREAIDPEGALVRQILDSVEPQLTGPAEEGGGSAEAVRAEESGSPAPPSSSLLKPSPFQGPGEAGPRGGPGASSGFLRPSPFEEGGGPTGGAPASDRSRWETEVMSRVRLAHGVLSAAPPDAQLAYNSLIAAVEALAAMHAETEFESNPRLLVDLVRLQNHLNEGATALRPHIGRTPDLARIREALNPEGEMISPYREQVERGLQRTR